MTESRLQQTVGLGTDFWNDSCDERELREALDQGAVGATSNPVIVASVVKNDPARWHPAIDRLVSNHPAFTEDDVAGALIAEIGRQAAKWLMPVFERSGGRKGRLSLQVDPKRYRDAAAMLAMAEGLREVAPNIAVKLPAVPAGIEAMEEATARGIVVTPTVCFSVGQAVAAAEAIERGLDRAAKAGIAVDTMRPNVALMAGRLDDHLKRVMEAEQLSVDPGILEWAGVAVLKRAYAMFKRRGFRSVLLSAAYRNHMHWSELVGGDLTVSIPYSWWRRFNNSTIEVAKRIDEPVCPRILEALTRHFADFRRAYEPDGLGLADFTGFGPTAHTLNQFIAAQNDLSALIRGRMLKEISRCR